MKKILVSIVALSMAMTSMAQLITFDKTSHNFGDVNQADGDVSTIFTFKNEGMAPLVLNDVRPGCGCTASKWPKQPIEPGETGEIVVTYRAKTRPGSFTNKSITVKSNSIENPTVMLYISGNVIPKPAKPDNSYSIKMGDLSVKSQTINFGNLLKGQVSAMQKIEYANLTDHDVTTELQTNDHDHYLISQTTLGTIQPNRSGEFQFILDSKQCPLYGPVETTAYVIVNDKRVQSDTYKITIKGFIQEDFSQLTEDERKQAPFVEMKNSIDLGELPAGKKVKKNFTVANIGSNPLYIRRAYSESANVEVSAPNGAIKEGKKADIKLTINTMNGNQPMEAGQYTRQFTVITNDPQKAQQTITLKWIIK